MSIDDFEQKLRRQESRPIPSEWRAEILQAARGARRPLLEAARSPNVLSALFWPSPKAWAGLAAIWLLLLGFHWGTQDQPEMVARKTPSSPPDLRLALREQARLLAELAEPREPQPVDRPKPQIPRPRSERRDEWFIA